MIRDQWYVVLESRDVTTKRPLGVTRMGEKLVFWRDSAGKVVCMRDLCAHLGARLSQGRVCDGHLACPFHGFEYDSTGRCVYLPALGRKAEIPKAMRVDGYPTYEAHGLIWIYWGDPAENLAPPDFFESLLPENFPGFSYGSFRMHWNVHYSRVAENQLDVMHLPYIHHNTIGRGMRTVVDGPYVRVNERNLLDLWVYNRADNGTPARKMEELPEPTRHPFLQFQFPNLWQNWISDDIRILIAFVPIDEENTLMLGRFYQRSVRIPLLREIFNLSGVWGSIVIANQDRRIVNQQFPKRTDLRIGEKITQGDRAVLTYRQHRKKLQEKNTAAKT